MPKMHVKPKLLARVKRVINTIHSIKWDATPTLYARLEDAASRLSTAIGVRNAFNRKRKPRQKRNRRRSRAKPKT